MIATECVCPGYDEWWREQAWRREVSDLATRCALVAHSVTTSSTYTVTSHTTISWYLGYLAIIKCANSTILRLKYKTIKLNL